MNVRVFLLFAFFCIPNLVFAKSIEYLSDDALKGYCKKASEQNPFQVFSKEIKGSQGQKAQTLTRCWSGKVQKDTQSLELSFAFSELLIDGRKVYSTPKGALALEVSCGSAAGEIYKPHSWSPNGKYFAFLLIPFCWETEPLAPVVMFNRFSDKNTKAPNFSPMLKELFQRYPKAKQNKEFVDFLSTIVGWRGKDESRLFFHPKNGKWFLMKPKLYSQLLVPNTFLNSA